MKKQTAVSVPSRPLQQMTAPTNQNGDPVKEARTPERGTSIPSKPTSDCRKDWALYYAKCGFKVFPMEPNTLNDFYLASPDDATTDERTIESWWNKLPESNIGIVALSYYTVEEEVCGETSEYHVLMLSEDVETDAGWIYETADGNKVGVVCVPPSVFWGGRLIWKDPRAKYISIGQRAGCEVI